MRIRQPSTIHRDLSAPTAPVLAAAMTGEKAKDSSAGVMVLFQMEQRPNTPPKMPPAMGPSKMAPMMTGMCRVVALMRGRGIRPMPVMFRKS